MAHARLSPSSAEKWISCPGSVSAESAIRDSANIYSAEGTVAHLIRSFALDLNMEPHDFIGMKVKADGFEIDVTIEMANHLQPGIDWLREQPGKAYFEHRVDLSRWLPKQFGTLDAGIVGKRFIVINDLKYGLNPVPVAYNKQLMLYALGFWHNIARHVSKADRFLLKIDQPRAPGKGGDVWEIALEELLEFGEQARIAGKKTYSDDPEFVPGDHCRNYYCKARDTCQAFNDWNAQMLLEAIEAAEEDEPLPDPSSLRVRRKAVIAANAAALKKWIDRVNYLVLQDVLAGKDIPGVKAVFGNAGDRTWISETAAELKLSEILPDEKCFSKKLISPAQAEKVLGKKRFADLQKLVTRDDPKPVLVSSDDAREPIRQKYDDFDWS